MNFIQTFDKIIQNDRFLQAGRRAVAAVLAAAMLAPAGAFAAAPPTSSVLLNPPQVERLPDGTSPEDPTIQIEGNFVRDEFGFLTETFELALRVKAPVLQGTDPETGDPTEEVRAFRTLSVSLAYDTEFMHPVSWEWVKGADPNNAYDIDMDTENYYDVMIPTQKDEWVTTAAAQGGIPAPDSDAAAELSGQVKDGKLGLLHFTSNSYKENELREMTTIAVIRFSVADQFMEKVSIKKNPLLKGGYEVSYDGTKVEDMAQLQTAMGKAVQVVDFAVYDDIAASWSLTQMALYYSDEHTQLGYIPDFDPANPVTKDTTVEVGGNTLTIPRPDTPNTPDEADLILAKKEGAEDYSFLTNLIFKGNITFPIVSDLSFLKGGTDLDKLTTIVYVDWDNKLLGTQIVPKRSDVRQLVSDHVAQEFVHEDLRQPTQANIDSIKRTDSYRGRYPYSGPGGDASEIISDGEKWPLTYKLDYTFFKRPMTHPGEKPDPKDTAKYPGGESDSQYILDLEAWESSDSWVQVTGDATGGAGLGASGDPDYEDALLYPFAYGWAECTADNFEDVWTTLGSSPSELSNYAVDANGVATVDYDGEEDFKFADLEKGFTESTVFLKAIYEPGDDTELDKLRLDYLALEPVYYGQYGGVDSSTPGTSYVLRFQYERITEEGRGLVRTRKPSVRVAFTPIVTETDETTGQVTYQLGNPFYMEVPVDNVDLIDVEITPSAEIYSVGYTLTDGYGDNYVTGLERSHTNQNVLEIYKDFDFDEYPLYEDHLGSKGFVYEGTFRHMLELGVEVGQGNQTALSEFLTAEILWDLNIRKNDSGAYYSTVFDMNYARNKLRTICEAAYAAGGEDAVLSLDWHQIQYHMLNSDNQGNGGAILGSGQIKSRQDCINDHGNYDWCKLHGASDTCTGTGGAGGVALPITNWSELLEAAYDYRDHANAMNNLTAALAKSPFSFAKDTDGTPYATADLSTLRGALRDAMLAANTQANDDTAYQRLTWGQVQYYLLNGSFPAVLTDADDTAETTYWWVNDGGQATDLATTLTAAERAADPAFVTPDGKSHTGWRANLRTITSDMDKVSNAPLRLRQSKDDDPDDGTPYPDADAFETALKDLVTKAKAAAPTGWDDANTGLGNWDILQFYLIHSTRPYDPTADDADIQTEAPNYWWRYGTQVKDWATLMEAADTYKDGTDPDAMLLKAVTADLLTSDDAGIWLRKDEKGTPFEAADMTTFVDAIKAITDALDVAGKKMATDATWDEVQYLVEEYVRTGSVTYPPAASDVQDRVDHHYWWKDAGVGVTDITTLVQAAQQAYGTDGTDGKRAMLSSVEYYGIPEDLRKSFDGTAYTSETDFQDDMIDFIPAAKAEGYILSTVNWSQVQYYLIHGTIIPETDKIDAEAQGTSSVDGYYWWAPEDWTTVGNKVTITTDQPSATGGTFNPNSDAPNKALADAMFRSGINKNAHAWDDMSDTAARNLRLVTSVADGATSDAGLTFATASDVTDKLDKLAKNIVTALDTDKPLTYLNSKYGYNAANKRITLDWYVLQYALLHDGALIPDQATYTSVQTDYWWLDSSDTSSATGTVVDSFMDVFDAYLPTVTTGNTAAANGLKPLLTDDLLDSMNLYLDTAMTKKVTGNGTNRNTARTRLGRVVRFLLNNPSGNTAALGYDSTNKKLNLTWYQVQWLVVQSNTVLNTSSGVLPDPVTAYNDVTGWGMTPPAKIPTTPGTPGADQLPNRVSGISLSSNMLSLRPMMMARPMETLEPQVTEETQLSPDGLTQTTKTTTRTWNEEIGDWDTRIVTVAVTRIETGETTVLVTTTTVVTTAYDEETGEYVTHTETNTSTQVEQPPVEAPDSAYNQKNDTVLTLPEEGDNDDVTVGTAVPGGPADEPSDTDTPIGETDEPDGTDPTDETPDEPATPPSSDLGSAEATFPPHGGEGSTTDAGDTSIDNVGAGALTGPADDPADTDISTGETAKPDETEPTDETPNEPAAPPRGGASPSPTEQQEVSSDNVGAAALGGPSDTPTGETDQTASDDTDPLTAGVLAVTRLLDQDGTPAQAQTPKLTPGLLHQRLQASGLRLYAGEYRTGDPPRLLDPDWGRWRLWDRGKRLFVCVTGSDLKKQVPQSISLNENNGRKLI